MSKTVYLAGEARLADAVRLPADREKTAYIRFIPEDEATGGGLPPFIAECCVQTFTPTADTNDAITFTLTGLTDLPEIMLVGCDRRTPNALSDYGGIIAYRKPWGYTAGSWIGHSYYRTGGADAKWSTTNTITGEVSDAAADAVTITPHLLGSNNCYWRAGWTYTIVALRLDAGQT